MIWLALLIALVLVDKITGHPADLIDVGVMLAIGAALGIIGLAWQELRGRRRARLLLERREREARWIERARRERAGEWRR